MDQLDGWTVAKSAWGILVTILGVMSMRQVKRIDDLEKTSASKKELEHLESRVSDEMTDLRQERRDRDDRLDQRLDEGFRSIHDRIDGLYHRKGSQ